MPRQVRLFRYERASGILVVCSLVLALLIANSSFEPVYRAIHHLPVHLRFGPLVIDEPLVVWINDGLMAFFFLLVGLEIKRQYLEGQLATPGRARLPLFAALGGMLVPAAIYLALNWTNPEHLDGWAIPTATDIVLALGLLSLLGDRVPVAAKIFLTALAIFDDIGAVLIIALFYGEQLHLLPSIIAVGSVVALLSLNKLDVPRRGIYLAVGIVLWVAMFKSGMEAALAGVIVGACVPLRTKRRRGRSPLRELERHLHPFGTLFVVPLFAFLNAGVSLEGVPLASLISTSSIGIVCGLFIGKQLGVFGGAWLSVRLGYAELPTGLSWAQIYGTAVLAGIGFTMSLFIASLAFLEGYETSSAKLAILIGSALSATAGLGVLTFVNRQKGLGGLR